MIEKGEKVMESWIYYLDICNKKYYFQGRDKQFLSFVAQYFRSVKTEQKQGIPDCLINIINHDRVDAFEECIMEQRPIINDKYLVGKIDYTECHFSPREWMITLRDSIDLHLYTDNLEAWKLMIQVLRDCIIKHCSKNDVLPLHAAAVVKPEGCTILLGEDSVGKSSFAIALGLLGCPIISDDRIFISFIHSELLVSSLGIPITFRAGTARLIPELAQYEVDVPHNVFTDPRLNHNYKVGIDEKKLFMCDSIYQWKGSQYDLVFLSRDTFNERTNERPREDVLWHLLMTNARNITSIVIGYDHNPHMFRDNVNKIYTGESI